MNTFLGMLGLLLCGLSLLLIRTDLVLTGAGVVEYSHSKRMYAPYGGVVEEVLVEEGDWVEAGQPLLKITDADSKARLLAYQREQAILAHRLAMAELDLQMQDLQGGDAALLTSAERVKRMNEIRDARQLVLEAIERLRGEGLGNILDLRRERVAKLESEIAALEPMVLAQWEEKGLSGLQRERLQAAVDGISAELSSLEAEIAWWENRVRSGTLVAPFRGRLVNVSTPYTGMAVEEGALLFLIADEESPLQVEALFGQRDIDLAREGFDVRLSSEVNSSPLGGEYNGKVMKVVPFPVEDGPEGPVYQIDVSMEEVRFPPTPGSEMEVEIVLGRRSLWDLFRDSLTGIPSRERILTSETPSPASRPETAL